MTGGSVNTHSSDQVCLLIDFENMVRGLASLVGDERLADAMNVGVLFGLAEEYGRVVLARVGRRCHRGNLGAAKYPDLRAGLG